MLILNPREPGTWVTLQVEMLLWCMGSREKIWDVGKGSVHNKVPRNCSSLQTPRGLILGSETKWMLSAKLCPSFPAHAPILWFASSGPFVAITWEFCPPRSDLLWKSLGWSCY